METVPIRYILGKFAIDTSLPLPWPIPIGRFKDVPRLFRELGFKIGAEIGVYQGEYSKWLLRMIPGLKLYGVDAWQAYGDYKDFEASDIQDAYVAAQANVKGYDCELIRAWSVDAAARFADASLDFIFIDGNHSYEHVVADLAAWSPKVRSGGIIYGHDYDDYSNSHRWREMHVQQAVQGWVSAYQIAPWFVLTRNKNKSWLYVQP